MTYKILTDDNQKIIWRSVIRFALDPSAPNIRLDFSDGEDGAPSQLALDADICVKIIKLANIIMQEKTIMVITPEDMRDRTFLIILLNNGERYRANIV